MTTATIEHPFMKLSTCSEIVASGGAATVRTGERLRLYDAMTRLESVSSFELAMAGGIPVWYAEGWLQAQVDVGFAVYESETERFCLFCRIEC